MRSSAFSRAVGAARLPAPVRAALLRARPHSAALLARAYPSDAEAALEAVAELLERGGSALELSPGDALFAGGYDPADAGPGRLAAALAELQAAAYLSRAGVKDLRLLPRCASLSADLCGSWRGETAVFEVRSLSGKVGSPLEYLFSKRVPAAPPEAVTYLGGKFDKKLRQLNCSRRAGNCVLGGLVFSADVLREASPAALAALAGAVHSAKNSPAGTAVIILAGIAGAACPWPRGQG